MSPLPQRQLLAPLAQKVVHNAVDRPQRMTSRSGRKASPGCRVVLQRPHHAQEVLHCLGKRPVEQQSVHALGREPLLDAPVEKRAPEEVHDPLLGRVVPTKKKLLDVQPRQSPQPHWHVHLRQAKRKKLRKGLRGELQNRLNETKTDALSAVVPLVLKRQSRPTPLQEKKLSVEVGLQKVERLPKLVQLPQRSLSALAEPLLVQLTGKGPLPVVKNLDPR